MLLKVTLLANPLTFQSTLNRILCAFQAMIIDHCGVGSFVTTIWTGGWGSWAVGAVIFLVPLKLILLEAFATTVRTGHSHKLALSLNKVEIHN
jgi:bacteriorhodopsin